MLLIAVVVSSQGHSQEWQGEFKCLINNDLNSFVDSFPKLDFIENTPYIIFQDENLEYKITVMKKNGTGSDYVVVGNPGFTAGYANNISSAVSSSNELHVVYLDGANENKLSVMKFNNSNWVQVGNAGFSTGLVSSSCICFIGDTPYVAYNDYTNGFDNIQITVMSFNGTEWTTVGTPNFTEGELGDESIQSDGTHPYVVYSDSNMSNKITVKKFDGSNWVTVGTEGFSTTSVIKPDIDFDGTTPFVCYTDNSFLNRPTVKKFDGSNWVNIGLPGFTEEQAIAQRFKVYNGVPYVAYYALENCGQPNGSRLTVMKFNGSFWDYLGNPCFSDSNTNSIDILNSFAINNNKAYVLFTDECDFLWEQKLSMSSYDITLSTNEHLTEKVTVTPNPFSNQIIINNLVDDYYQYEVVNVLGKIMTTGNVLASEASIDLETLTSGIYFYDCTTNSILLL